MREKESSPQIISTLVPVPLVKKVRFRTPIKTDVTASQVALVKDWLVVKRVIFSQKYISPKIYPYLPVLVWRLPGIQPFTAP